MVHIWGVRLQVSKTVLCPEGIEVVYFGGSAPLLPPRHTGHPSYSFKLSTYMSSTSDQQESSGPREPAFKGAWASHQPSGFLEALNSVKVQHSVPESVASSGCVA